MRDPFDYPLEPMTPQRAETLQKEQQARNSWMATGIVILLVAFVIFGAIMLWMGKTSQEDLGGEPGAIQDGVYYVYGGSGFVLPNEIRVPIGLCAYTPGQEPEILVSAEDYSLNTIFPCWNVNAQGLFFFDQNTCILYRMDLNTREITSFYAFPETDPAPVVFFQYLDEEQLIVSYNLDPTYYYLTLDCRTGEVLTKQKEKPPELAEPQEGTLAYEVQRLALSQGTVMENGEENWYNYLAFAAPWLFYVKQFPNENPAIAAYHSQLWVMNVETEERYLVQDEIEPYHMVTDGNWFYICGGDTDCYQLEYNDQGIPCGLTLIEERI